MTKNRREEGKHSEQIAENLLIQKNHSIINKNWHSGKYGEIDLITKDNSTGDLVFVEVKSRTTSLSDAKELINRRKQLQLYKLAKSYLYLKGKEDCSCRFDVIAIKIGKDKSLIEHIKNAF